MVVVLVALNGLGGVPLLELHGLESTAHAALNILDASKLLAVSHS